MRFEIKQKIEESYAATNDKDPNSSSQLLEEAFALASSPEEEREAALYVRQLLKKSRKRVDVDVASLLADIRGAVSLSFIAEHYFGKNRSWLSQRLNGSIVNGKPTAFTNDELKTLSKAFLSLSNKMLSVSSEIQKSI